MANLNTFIKIGANTGNFVGSITGSSVSASGNVIGGNISATGNITSGNFIGSPSANIIVGNKTWKYDNVAFGASQITFPDGTSTIYNAGSSLTITGPSIASLVSGNNNITVDFLNGTAVTGDFSATGNISGNTAGYTIGYKDIPQISFSANTTASLTDAGKHYYSTTAGNLQLTLPDNSNVAFSTGATLTVVVNAAGNVLVTQGTGVTLYMAGSSTTGNRVVGAYGLASVMKVAANTWVISGTGVY